MMLNSLKRDMQLLADPEKARILSGFFKTGQGEYGEGDVFLGIKVPEQRAVARKYSLLDMDEIAALLSSKIHEHRLTALLILVGQYKKAAQGEKKRIFGFYLAHARGINNWDLVDLSAPNIVGDYILSNPKQKGVIYRLAKSRNIWERRVAILSTLAFIRSHQCEDTFKIAELLLDDEHDLIHKAAGWMLREAGKRNQPAAEMFLRKYGARMPRTMLRYAIERFPPGKRRAYLRR